jgi:hypothetical protein
VPQRATRRQRRQRTIRSAQLKLDFTASATVAPRVDPALQAWKPPAGASATAEADEALLAAAVRRLRARARQWIPPMLDITPDDAPGLVDK